MKYIFIQDGKEEEIEPEKWGWGVVYFNGTELHQFDSNGIFHQIKEIKWGEVKMFTMYQLNDMSKRVDIVVTPDMQLFHFYRNIKPYYAKDWAKVYVFGFKIRGTSQAVYNYILPNDTLVQSDRDNIDLINFPLSVVKK